MPAITFITRAVGATCAMALAACATGTSHRAASVVDYLYPSNGEVVVQPSIPTLTLPIKVGIAFVPTREDAAELGVVVPESDRQKLMNQIADHFRQQPYVKNIETIPTSYLSPRGGFPNLEQVSRMFDVDVIALLSYDQVQFTTSSRSSITYWTLLGAYIVQGEKNDTRTLLDAALFDVKSHKLLFRAPGVSTVKGTATPVDVEDERRKDAGDGFRVATANLLTNLDTELASFQTKVRESKTDVKIVASEEYKSRKSSGGGSGGGAADPLLIGAAALLVAGAFVGRRSRSGK
jgi:rhombotail lipoprotein